MSAPPAALEVPAARRGAARDAWVAWVVTAALWLAFGVFVLYPLVEIGVRSFWKAGHFTLEHYTEFLREPRLFRTVWNSLVVSALSTVLTVSLAFGYAYVLTHTSLWGRPVLWTVGLLPLIAPSFMQALGLIFLFGRNGLVTRALLGTDWNIYGPVGIVLGEVFYCFPHALLVLHTSLSAVDASLYEAAQSLGARGWRVFWWVTVPTVRYALAASAFLVFNLVITDFGTPVVVGGDFRVLATEIYTQVFGLQRFGMAAVVSMVLLVPALASFALDGYFRRKAAATLTGQSRPFAQPTRGWARVAAGVFAWGWAGFILLIYGTLAAASVVRVWGYDWTLTLAHYRFEAVGARTALPTGLKLSGLAAGLGALLSVLVAYVVHRLRPRGSRLLYALAVLPAAIPGTVVGLGYLFAFNRPPLVLVGTAAVIVLSYVFRFVTLGTLAAGAALQQVDRSVEEAAHSLGAGTVRTFVHVVFPLLRVAFFSSAVYIFVRSMVTLSAVIFLIAPGLELPATAVLTLTTDGKLAAAAALSTVLVGLIVGVVAAARWVLRVPVGFR